VRLRHSVVVAVTAARGLLTAVGGSAAHRSGPASSHCAGRSLEKELDVSVLHVLFVLRHRLPGICLTAKLILK